MAEKVTKGIPALTPGMDCDQITMGLPTVTSAVLCSKKTVGSNLQQSIFSIPWTGCSAALFVLSAMQRSLTFIRDKI
jgi:hypothetical protein